jgi:hypothetical protein
MASFKAKLLPGPLVIGQTAPGSPVVSDVPVAGGTERVLFLGIHGARALLVLLPGTDGIVASTGKAGSTNLAAIFGAHDRRP